MIYWPTDLLTCPFSFLMELMECSSCIRSFSKTVLLNPESLFITAAYRYLCVLVQDD